MKLATIAINIRPLVWSLDSSWVSNSGITLLLSIDAEDGMPAKRKLTMRELRDMLRLARDDASAREIGRILGVARSTALVHEYILSCSIDRLIFRRLLVGGVHALHNAVHGLTDDKALG